MEGTFKKALSALAVFAILFTVGGCSLLPTEEDVIAPPLVEPEVVEYKTTQVEKGDIIQYSTLSGTFVSTLQYDVSFEERGGYLSELFVAQGSEVEEGQILAELDVDALQAQIRQQEYTVEKLQINYEMTIDGKNKGMMTENELRQIRLAEIDLELAQIQLDELRNELGKSTIYAPASGTVVYLADVKPGSYVNARQTIVRIADPESLYLKYDGEDVSKLALNTEVEVTIQNQKYNGSIVVTPQTAPEEVASERQYVLIEVEDRPDGMKIGDLATGRVVMDKRTDVVKVSRTLVSSYGSGSYYVQVLKDGVKQDVAIEVGLMTSTEVEVLSGLAEGDEIIVR